MNILDIIMRKKNKGSLSYDEIKYAFEGYLNGDIPDYQMSALLMAITLNGMNMSETLALTDIFIKSGDTYEWSNEGENIVDKHSTGGVGDTTTLIVGPIVASLGLHMAKMSGRGLGLTGGTIDKLESIPGFDVCPDEEAFFDQVSTLGFAISSQKENLVPLDKVIYALRDVTGTTESIPLIASSIMSKKIASGAKNILIDIKLGSGALIKTKEEANQLSEWLIDIGDAYKKNVKTIITDMNKPLSNAIGNALEVAEAINVLHGTDCALFRESIRIAAILYAMAKEVSYEEAKEKALEKIEDGSALKCFYEFISSQGGDLSSLHISDKKIIVKAKNEGIIEKIDALGAARLAQKLGASKMTLEDTIDYGVGIYLHVKIGDTVQVGDELATLYIGNDTPTFTEDDFTFIQIA